MHQNLAVACDALVYELLHLGEEPDYVFGGAILDLQRQIGEVVSFVEIRPYIVFLRLLPHADDVSEWDNHYGSFSKRIIGIVTVCRCRRAARDSDGQRMCAPLKTNRG